MSLPPFAAMINPEELAKHYTRFRVTERILLTGHSHQAWPDVAFEAQQQAWLDTAEFVDDVWDKAFEKANDVRRGFARLMDDSADNIALAPNTHELVVRFLSALPLKKRPKLITTDGEFHTIRRQLDRLSEEGIEVGRRQRWRNGSPTRSTSIPAQSWSPPCSIPMRTSCRVSARRSKRVSDAGLSCWSMPITRSTSCRFH